MQKSFVVIGGGFFGCYAAARLRAMTKGPVTILERESGLMMRASYNNQARVHRGYHYPRNILTGLCSSTNFARFISEFKECIYDDFEQYYAIGKIQSKVTASQYKTFCRRIGAPLDPAPARIKAMFNFDLIEEVFLAQECAFDAKGLTKVMSQRLADLDIPVKFNTEVTRIVKAGSAASGLRVIARDSAGVNEVEYNCDYVINCAYSNINTILTRSGIPKLNLKEEMTEMAIVDLPPLLKDKGVTVMCGPFFSLMPFPPRSLHLLAHVRYTPHYYWYDRDVLLENDRYFEEAPRHSRISEMIQDAQRYLPVLKESRYVDSMWEIKTILPQNEIDDGRPILFQVDTGMKNVVCVMGGKIDNVFELDDELEKLI